MTFEELQLAMAISKVGISVKDAMSRADALEFMSNVQRMYTFVFDGQPFPFAIDDVMRVAISLRKSVPSRVKADVALVHGHRCFWNGRNRGPCCDDAECGHLVPDSSGGDLSVENCVIECRSHNNQRRNMTIEQYIASGLRT